MRPKISFALGIVSALALIAYGASNLLPSYAPDELPPSLAQAPLIYRIAGTTDPANFDPSTESLVALSDTADTILTQTSDFGTKIATIMANHTTLQNQLTELATKLTTLENTTFNPSGSRGNVGIDQVAISHADTAVLKDGVVYGAGYNRYGDLGDGTGTTRLTPVKMLNGEIVGGNQSISQITFNNHSLIILKDGVVYGTGYNYRGELGDGTTTNKTAPVKMLDGEIIGGNSGIDKIVAGRYYTILLLKDGVVYGVGNNDQGQLGDGTATTRLTPVKMLDGVIPGGNAGIADIAIGGHHSLLLKDGIVYSVGYNRQGALGDGTTTNKYTPVKMLDGEIDGGNSDIDAIVAGTHHTLLLKNGVVYSMGLNSSSGLGDGTKTNRTTPVKMLDGEITGGNFSVDAVSGGALFSLILKDGIVYGVGYNGQGALGDGTTVERSTPVKMADGAIPGGNSGVTSIWASGYYDAERIYSRSAVIKDDSVYVFGRNDYGQLGDGTSIQRTIPVKMADGEIH